MKDAFEGVSFTQVAAGAGAVAAAIATVVEAVELLNATAISQDFFKAEELDERIKKLKEFRDSIKDVPLVAQIQLPKLDKDIAELEKLKKSYEDLGIPIPKVSELLSTYEQRQQTATGGTKELNAELALTPEAALAAADAISKVPAAQDTLNASVEKGSTVTKDYRAVIEDARQGIGGFVQSQTDMAESSNTLTVKLHEQNEAATENIQQTNALVGTSENYNQVSTYHRAINCGS